MPTKTHFWTVTIHVDEPMAPNRQYQAVINAMSPRVAMNRLMSQYEGQAPRNTQRIYSATAVRTKTS